MRKKLKRFGSWNIIPIILLTGFACTPNGEVPHPYLLNNNGNYSVKISTTNMQAQDLFDQGLVMAYGFNHAEAARSFRKAIEIDPECGMCYWGLSYVLGPNINAPMDPSMNFEAYYSINKGAELVNNLAGWEKSMIESLQQRYSIDSTVERGVLNIAFAKKMRETYKLYPEHPEVATITAEALMTLHPWDLYEKDGTPQPWTTEIVKILESVLQNFPEHPGANHFYIHSVEASVNPDKGLASAKKLEELVPSSGHLTHMPSHIYIRTGKYHEGTIANEKAVIADSLYITNCNANGFYPMVYYPHNYHFLAATASFEGDADKAINAAYKTAANTYQKYLSDPGYGFLQHYFSIPLFVLVKFHQWDHVIEYPEPDSNLSYTRAIWHYARGMAFLGKGDTKEAKNELKKLIALSNSESVRTIVVSINFGGDVTEIASNVLQGEIAAFENNYDAAITSLQKALAVEDSLSYIEPPDWFFSVRHHLGNIYLESGQYESAETVYRQDLRSFPNNGWALNGLVASLKGQKNKKYEEIEAQFESAWKYATVTLEGSKVKNAHRVTIKPESKIPSSEDFKDLAFCGSK